MRPSFSAITVAGLVCLAGVAPLRAGSFTANFDDGQVPNATAVFGNAVVETAGGVGSSGTLKLTKAIASQTGTFIIEDLDAGAMAYGFQATMKVRVGGGTATPADGWSFNFAPDLPDSAFAEDGAGTGLTVCFDTYDNGSAEAPAVDFKVGGVIVSTVKVPVGDLVFGNTFVPVTIRVNPNGSLDLAYNGKVMFTNFFFPNYAGLSSARFGFGARTGGSTANHFIDDLNIQTYLQPAVGFVRQPASQTVLEGRQATFSAALNNADIATLQWFRNDQAIPNANSDTLVLDSISAADDGAKFVLKTTANGVTLASQEVTLRVTHIELPAAPALSFDFNDASIPASTALFGTAVVEPTGGVGDSGVLKLTIADINQAGAFVVEDPQAGAPVYGFAASFQIRLGEGTDLPADGFSFNFAADIPDEAAGELENGVGTGISVCFDTYDNGGGEAPAVELRVNRAIVATAKVLPGFLVTSGNYADVVMRLTPDGLFDLAWNGVVLFEGVKVEGFGSMTGGRFGLAARTGGADANHWVDDLKLYSYLNSGLLRITTAPKPQTVLLGKTATFTAEANQTANLSYKWLRNGQAISGAVQNTLTLPGVSVADDQAKYRVEITGPDNKVTSDEAVLTVVNLAPPANPSGSFNFDDGLLPPKTRKFGTAVVVATGGVNDSGVMQLTIAENGQSGAFIIDPLESGAEATGFTAAFDVLVGGGSAVPADGFSFNFAPDVPLTTIGEAEKGGGTGITVGFDIYVNADLGEVSPTINLKYKGLVVVSKPVPLSLLVTDDKFVTVLIRVRPEGQLDLAYGDTVVFNAQPIPGYKPIAGGRIGFAARTGGLNANQWVDNIRIQLTKPIGPTRITSQPADVLVLVGQPAVFSVLVSDPTGVTYQWFKNGAPIAGPAQATYTTESLTASDSGSVYTVKATGPGGEATGGPAKVTVLQPFFVANNPLIDFNFNDGAVPPGSIVLGTALVDTMGGVSDSGVLKLTMAEGGQTGSFLIDTPQGINSIQDFVATWKVLIGGGSEPPADGFCFVAGPDLADSAFNEDGAGTGLVVSFDTYDNGGGEAPAIDVLYKGNSVASHKLPISVLRPGDQFVTVALRVRSDGNLDLIYGTNAIFANVLLPGYEPLAQARFGFGGRTGGSFDNHWVDDLRIAINSLPAQAARLQLASPAAGKISITWTGGGVLQSAGTLSGQWLDLPTATSPFEIQTAEQMRFYRVKQ